MKVLVVILLVLVAVVSSKSIDYEDVVPVQELTAYDYHKRIGIPLAKKIRISEAQPQSRRNNRLSFVRLGLQPYQVGLLVNLQDGDTSVCGGTILHPWRVLTSAHCWTDGRTSAINMTVVAGSVSLFSGGERLHTNNVVVHPGWNPSIMRDDLAMIVLPSALGFTLYVGSILLPSGLQVNQDFVGHHATATGYRNDTLGHQSLVTYDMIVMSNQACNPAYGIVFPSTLCTESNFVAPCDAADSGGSLTTVLNEQRILIGVSSFSSAWLDVPTCGLNFPTAYTRVTHYLPWIHQNM